MRTENSYSLKTFIEQANASLPLLSKVAPLLGILPALWYCSLNHFSPKGLSLSDGVVLIMIFGAFAFVFLMGTLYGGFSSLWIFALVGKFQEWRISKWKKLGAPPDRLPNGMQLPTTICPGILSPSALMSFGVFAGALLMLALIYFHKYEKFWASFNLVASFMLVGMICLTTTAKPLVREHTPAELKGLRTFRLIALCAVIVIPFIFSTPTFLLEAIMSLATIRVADQPVELSADNFKRFSAVAQAMGVKLVSCDLPASGHTLVLNADTLWHGVGTQAQLRTRSEKSNSPQFSLSLDDAGVWPVVTSIDVKAIPCAKPAETNSFTPTANTGKPMDSASK